MSKYLVIGDPHLGKSVQLGRSGPVNSRVMDQMNILEWTLDQALIHNVQSIIITGDVYEDPKPQYDIINLFMSWLKKCESNGIRVDIIAGNHDLLRVGTIYSSPLSLVEATNFEFVQYHNDIKTLYFDDVAITILPFRDRKSLLCKTTDDGIDFIKTAIDYEVESIPHTYKKFIIGHMALKGSIPVFDEIKDITNELMLPLDIFSKYDYTIMGHIHQFQKFKNNIMHIGSMDISNFGETKETKKIIIISKDSFEEIDVPTRRLNKIVIDIPIGTEDTTEYVIEQIKKTTTLSNSITTLEISLLDESMQKIDRKKVEAHLYDNGVFNVSSIAETKVKKIVRQNRDNKITSRLDVSQAIDKWANLKYTEQSDRDKFKGAAMNIYTEFLSTGVK